uniref:Transmembrane and immunoglobulin domain containing 1 n=1 Tax=Salarias fasciatus TaxID=181472 RepID=A0A672HMG1_SALFA
SKMKVMWRIALLCLLFYCASQTLESNVDGIININEEAEVSLVCEHQTTSETEDDELVWLRNGMTVQLKEENRNGRSVVCISPAIRADNEATFECHLRKNRTLADSLSGSEDVSVEEKETLVLRCDIQANPPVLSVVWTLNDTRVELTAGGFTVSTDSFTSQLRVSDVKESMHRGTYKCTADGKHSKTFHVTVTGRFS